MNKIKLFTLCFIAQACCLFLIMGAGLASEQENVKKNSERFSRANLYYEKGNYEGAINEYESILYTGIKSAALYFNLANAYLEEEKLGKAILNYEKALCLMPRDGDILANSRYAKTLMKQQNPPSNKFFLVKGLDRSLGYLTLKEAIFVEVAIYLFIICGIIAALFLRNIRTYLAPLVIGAILVFFIELIPIVNKINDMKEGAIVIARITDATFEPLETSESVFPLYEGMKVSILRNEGEWSKIKRNDGKIGWVKSDTVSLIEM